MINLLEKSLPPQAAKIYKLMLYHPPLSAKEIGMIVKIVPNTVYRDLKELVRLGLVEEIQQYPLKYKAKPATDVIPLYNSILKQNFYELFKYQPSHDTLKLAFFHTRRDLLSMTEKDNYQAKGHINFIISGNELPAETVLSKKKAVERGVKIRTLLQGSHKEAITMAQNYAKMGIKVRFTPSIGLRIVTYDGVITYFGSYHPAKHLESMGVRFDYAPYTQLMDEMFEQKWQQAKETI